MSQLSHMTNHLNVSLEPEYSILPSFDDGKIIIFNKRCIYQKSNFVEIKFELLFQMFASKLILPGKIQQEMCDKIFP